MHSINSNRGTRSLAAHCLRLAGLGGAALLASMIVVADEADTVVAAHARYVAITVCGTCHGVAGNSTFPKFPRLAGQDAGYLARQLKAFRAETRGDPDAIAYMWGMASQLDDAAIDSLAAWYQKQQPLAGSARDPALIAQGREIYQNGVPSAGVPACSSCHGKDAHGTGDYPRLAGQHGAYILKQLASFQSNMRNVAIMHGVALNLRGPQMRAVAAYLEVQR